MDSKKFANVLGRHFRSRQSNVGHCHPLDFGQEISGTSLDPYKSFSAYRVFHQPRARRKL